MVMLASDLNNTQFSGAMDPDSVMVARFYMRAIKNEFKSAKEGRPLFEDVLYCEYYPAGSTLLRMDVPAGESHKMRFSKQWAYYQSTQKGDAREIGTPLDQWAILSPADVENLRGMKFYTIENVAGCSDQQLQSLGMGVAGMAPFTLRLRAQAYLGAAQDSALPQRQAEEIAKLKEDHQREMAELRAMIEANAGVKKKGKREWTDEQKEAARARMQKARDAKQQAA